MLADVGDSFTVPTAEGWDMVFTILDEDAKTCQVGYLDGSAFETAVDRDIVEGPVTIPATANGYTVVKIGSYAFQNINGMTSITIPNTVTTIEEIAFCVNDGLTSLEIPASVTSIGTRAFTSLSFVTSITVAEGNPNYDSRDNCNAIIETATNKLLFGCLTTTIPTTVTEIGGDSFINLDNYTLTIPSSVNSIDNSAFSGNNVTIQVERTIPLEIEEDVFRNMWGNSILRVPEGCKAAYAEATGWNRFENIFEGREGETFIAQTPEGYDMVFTIIDDKAKTCQVGYLDTNGFKRAVDRDAVKGSLTIPSIVDGYTVVKIGKYAFNDIYGITSVAIPNTVTAIEGYAFNFCYGLSSLDLPASLTTIGERAFAYCSLTSLEIPASVTTIRGYAFVGLSNATSITVEAGNPIYDSRDNCNAIIETATNKLLFGFKTTTIPATVTGIGERAFQNISDFTLTIPSSITTIDDYAFTGYNLTLQVEHTTPLEINESVFDLWGSTLRVPEGSKAAYADAAGWSRFDYILEGNEGATFIAKTAEGYDMVFAILDDKAKTCQVGYFDGDWGKGAVDKESVEGSLTIPATVNGYTVVKIGKYAFNEIYQKISVTIPNTVTTIGEYAFADCSGLTSLELPASVTTIGEYAFSGVSNVTSITVAAGNTTYDSRDNCNAIIETATNKLLVGFKATTIPATVTEIGDGAFVNLYDYTLTIPSTITTIDNYAFSGSRLTLQVERTTPLEITEDVFQNVWDSSLRVPVGSKAAYAEAPGWSSFDRILEGNEGATFTVQTAEGYDMVFTVLDETAKTCQVGYLNGSWDNPAVNRESVEGSVTIPEVVEGYTVVKIGKHAFNNVSGMTSVNIPNTVTAIDEYAFSSCDGLASFELPANVVSLGDYALISINNVTSFKVAEGNTIYDSRGNCNAIIEKATNKLLYGCKTTIIPASVTEIGSNAFYNVLHGCTIIIPSTITKIDDHAFSNTNMTLQVEHTTPLQINDEQYNGFESSTLRVPTGCKAAYASATGWKNFGSILEGNEGSVITSTTAEGWEMVFTILDETAKTCQVGYLNGSWDNPAVNRESVEGSVTIPEVVEGYTVVKIGKYALHNVYKMTSVTIPNTVTSIENEAFASVYNCTIHLPSAISMIGDYAFSWCENLLFEVEHTTPLDIQETVFNELRNSTLRVPAGCKSEYATATGWSLFSNIYEGNEGTYFTAKTAEGWDMVFTILDETDKTCQVGYLDGSWNKLAVDKETVEGSVTIPEIVNDYTVVKIGKNAFSNVYKMTSVTIPNTVTSIENEVFSSVYNCTIHLPSAISMIGDYAFNWCSDLTLEVEHTTPLVINENVFENINNSTLRVPVGCRDAYTTATGWMNFNEILEWASPSDMFVFTENPDGTTCSVTGYKDYCVGDVAIPESWEGLTVTSIGNNAFYSCVNLTSIFIPSSVTSIGVQAFSYCSNLTSIKVENGNTKYDSRDNCNAIIETATNTLIRGTKKTKIPNDVTSIGVDAFNGTGLTSMTIPNSVTYIANQAFLGCSSLTSLTISENVTYIGFSTFAGCSGLTSLTIPKNVTTIGDYAFSGCTEVASVTVKSPTPVAISEGTFANKANATLYVPEGSKAAYQAADEWKEFMEIVEAPVEATWTDSNGMTWSFTVSGTEARNIKPACQKVYIYGADPVQEPPFQPGSWDAAAMRFSSYEGRYLPTLSDEVYWGLKTLIFDVSDVSPDFDLKVMNGWWSNTYYDHVVWEDGLNELQITQTMAADCARGYGGGGKDLNLMLTEGSVTINAVYYESVSILNPVVVIPAKVYDGSTELTVTSIAERAFDGCSNMTSITIPSSVTSVGSGAFYGCSGLTSIVVEDGNAIYDSRDNCNAIIETGTNTLIAGCNNTVIPSSVTSIGEGAFKSRLYMPSMAIPNSVTAIGNNAFSGCGNLTSISIPSSVTSIGENAFSGCSNLTSVSVKKGTPLPINENTFTSRTNATLFVPQGSKDNYLAADYWQEFKEIVEINTTPSNVINFADANVKAICVASWDFDDDGELSESEAASITDPSLGHVFRNKSYITSFDELSYFIGLTSIGSEAFSGCSGLTSVVIPNCVTSIDYDAFYNCSGLTSITIPNSVTSIGDWAFSTCSGLTSMTIPNSVTSIGTGVFSNCNGLTSLSVESGNAKYDSRGGCNAIIETETNTLISGTKNTVIPNGVTSIGAWAFYSIVDMTSVTIPNSVTSIGEGAFCYCMALTSITIPNSVTSIGINAFASCDGLTSVIIPSSVTFIGAWAFSGCPNLTSVTVKSKTPITYAWAYEFPFSNRANATLYVLEGCKAAYQAAAYWNEFKEIVEIGMELPADEIFSGTNLWAGYVAQEDLIPGTGLKVYVITKLGTTTATASQIDYMPQGVPVLLKRADTTVSSYEVTSGTGTAPTTNLLRVFNADRNVSNREGFILFNDEFVLVNEGVLPAGRVFLPANNLQMSRGLTRSIVIDDDDATGIEGNRAVADEADEQWFDLQGRRLEQKPTKKGIYILNGRKVVVK